MTPPDIFVRTSTSTRNRGKSGLGTRKMRPCEPPFRCEFHREHLMFLSDSYSARRDGFNTRRVGEMASEFVPSNVTCAQKESNVGAQ